MNCIFNNILMSNKDEKLIYIYEIMIINTTSK